MTKLIKGEEGYKQGKEEFGVTLTRKAEPIAEGLVRFRYYEPKLNAEVENDVMYLAPIGGARIRPCLAEILKILGKPENASITHVEFEFNEIKLEVRRGDNVNDLLSYYEEVHDFMRKVSKMRSVTADNGVGV